MASRKLLGNLLLSSHSRYRHHLLTSQQVSTACTRLRLVPKDGSCAGYRQFGVLSDFREKLRDKAHRIHLQSIKEKVEWLKGTTEKLGKFGPRVPPESSHHLRRSPSPGGSTRERGLHTFSCVGQKFSDKLKVMSERLEELKGLSEDLLKLSSTSQEFKETLNAALEKMEVVEGAMEDLVISVASDQQTIEMLCNQMDGVQTEAEARTKKVKDSFGIVKEESSACSATSAKEDPSVKNRSNAVSGDSDSSKSYPMKLLRKFLLKFK